MDYTCQQCGWWGILINLEAYLFIFYLECYLE